MIRKLSIILLTAAWLTSVSACGGDTDNPVLPEDNSGNGDDNNDNNTENTENTMTMHIRTENRILTVTLEDNAAAHDLLARLPIEVTLEDFNNTTEKIFYPEPALNTAGVRGGCTPVPGDITIYAPWENVAIFCKNWSYSSDLIKIGHIDGDGIEALKTSGDIRVKFEK